MIVKVFYPNRETKVLEHVATMTLEALEEAPVSPEWAAELAWVSCQNLTGSWSMGPTFEDGTANGDYRPNLEVIKPLEEYNGRLYGHRSSMEGDVFEVDGVKYRCEFIGFEKIDE